LARSQAGTLERANATIAGTAPKAWRFTGEMDEIAEIVAKSNLSALIVSNTTLDRAGLRDQRTAKEAGGLSGKPLFEKSTRVLAEMHKRLDGKVPLIGVGGISSAQDVITKMEAGARLVQLYTGMIFEGPCLPAKIASGLSEALDTKNISAISDLIGTKTDEWI